MAAGPGAVGGPVAEGQVWGRGNFWLLSGAFPSRSGAALVLRGCEIVMRGTVALSDLENRGLYVTMSCVLITALQTCFGSR